VAFLNGGLARTSAAAAAAALTIAACSPAGTSSSSSSITAKGNALTIYLSEPANIKSDPIAQDITDAETLAFDQHKGEVTAFKLALQPLAQPLLSDNARYAIGHDTSAIAYLGELAPGASEQTVGITNAVDLLQLSPTDTAVELGAGSSVIAGSPNNYFESFSTYGRTFARVVPTSAQEAAFLVREMQGMGVKSVYVASDDSDYGRAIAASVKGVVNHAGLSVSTSQSGADAIFYGTDSPAAGASYLNMAAKAAPNAKLFGSSSLADPAFLSALSGAATNVYVSVPGIPSGQLNSEAKAFISAFKQRYGHAPDGQAIFGYAAMETLLSVMHKAGKSANNRDTVAKDFLAVKNEASVLGPFSIDSDGNTTLNSFVLNRVRGGSLVPVSGS